MITISDIRAKDPCYDPNRYLPEDWQGELVEIMRMQQVPAKDRVWVATWFLSDRQNRLFAGDCAACTMALYGSGDLRSVAAIDAAWDFANGLIGKVELAAAEDAAWGAAWSAAWGAAWAAARDAAWDAAWSAAWAAARDAAWAAARDAAGCAARKQQIEMILRILEEEE